MSDFVPVPPIRLLPVEPIGSHKAYGFGHGLDARNGIVEFTVNEYPTTPEAAAVADLRDVEPRLNFGPTARLLGITASQVCDLQRGSVVPADGWETVWLRLGRRP